ncbi:unnamed protein product [Arctia plantaginis]|uniref:Uncharacterized protein n=1 Tax=Arctia plantaginis TaxID=874455 RepID=A0A8S1A072_ARCPL|nr:unnamed protein product [Arctia plantaginis]
MPQNYKAGVSEKKKTRIYHKLFLLLHTAVDLKISKHEGNDQSVNLALDTIVEFDNKNNGEDIKFLDNVQKFIGKVKTVIVKKNMRRNFNGVDSKKLTDFILSLIQMLIKFEDTNLEDFLTIAGKEFKKYHYKGCKFYELIENYNLRRFLAKKLDEMKHTPADVMRRSLKAFASKIEEEKYDTNEKELIEYINSLYGQRSIELFNNILGSLDDYGLKANKNMNLSKIISAGIRSTVFDYYTELNRNARMALKTKLIEFFERTMGISTYATKSVEETKKNLITTQESTSKPKYVQQYLDSRNFVFRYSRGKPLLSSISVSYNSKKISNFYNIESHDKKKENDEEIVKPSKKQKNSNSKSINGYKYFTEPYYEKEKNRINYPISYKHVKIDKKNKRQTYRTMHPVKASIMDHTHSHKLKKNREHSIVTPKEPKIKNSNLDSTEFISHEHEMTTLKRAEESNMHEHTKEHLKHKYSNNITSSRLLRGKPLSDSETGSKYDVEPSMNHIFNQQPKTRKIKLKTSQKLTKVYDTDNSLSDDKIVSNIVKIPDDKLRTVDELQINQNVVKKPKSQKSKDIILTEPTKTTEPESIQIIAFDDLQFIQKRTTAVQKSAKKLPNKIKIKSLFEINNDKPTNTQRMTFNKLTFMTLYPEFIQKWSASGALTKKQRNDSINLKQTIRFKIRNTQTPYRHKSKNVSYNIRAKNIVTPSKTLNRQFTKPSWNRKAITKKNNIFRPEVSEAKLIRQLIVREKLKGFRQPVDVTSKVNNKSRNDLSSDLFNSEETMPTQEITEELETKIPYKNSTNNARRDFFIDLNIAQSPTGKELKVFTNGRRYEPNINKYKKSKPQKLINNINYISNEKLREKKLTSIESNDSKHDTDVSSYKKSPIIKNVVFQKTQDFNDVESDNNDFKNKVKDENLNLTRFSRADNKFKKYMNQKFKFDTNKYKHNLTRKLFIDLQNTEVKNLSVVGTSNEKNINIRRSNKSSMSDVKKDTRRMINEQDIQTKANAETDKKLNKLDFIQNNRDSFNEYTSTVRKKKIYFSYLNDDGKTDGYDLFYKQRIARGSKENSSTIKNQDDQYNSEYIPVTREPEKVTQFLEGRKNDKKYFKDTFNIGDKNVLNKIINQPKNNIKINELNNDIIKKDESNNFENEIDKKEKNTKTFMADRMNDPGTNSDKKLQTSNFNENVDSLQTSEDPIEISNSVNIDDGKLRLEDDANKLKDMGQSVVSTEVTETILNIQRRAPANPNVKEANINISDFKERQEASESNIKSSTIYFKPIAVTITTEKIPLKTLNVDTKQSITHVTNTIKSQEINDIKNSISSDLTTKNTFRNDQNDHKTNTFNQVTDKNDLQLNQKHITDMPKIVHHIKATNTTLSYFNVTSDKVSKLI